MCLRRVSWHFMWENIQFCISAGRFSRENGQTSYLLSGCRVTPAGQFAMVLPFLILSGPSAFNSSHQPVTATFQDSIHLYFVMIASINTCCALNVTFIALNSEFLKTALHKMIKSIAKENIFLLQYVLSLNDSVNSCWQRRWQFLYFLEKY